MTIVQVSDVPKPFSLPKRDRFVICYTRGEEGKMSFTVSEFRDLIQLLEQQPSWRAELRRWVLTEDILALPQTVQELAEAQRRTEASLSQLTERMGQLAERMDQLTERMDQLAERMDQLAEHMDQLTRRMDQVIDGQRQMETDLGRLKGSDLERRYRERAPAYFSRLIRRSHTLSSDELVVLIEEALAQGQLSEDEADDLYQTDVIVRGQHRDEGTALYLVVEVSWGVGISDVQRASERARLFAKLGTPTLPVVAGTWVTHEAQQAAQALQVWAVTNGQVVSPNAS
jgi:DNA-binding transcriptional MerR regulator